MTETFTCPVCGYPGLFELPWSADNGGSYEICPSCGFEFGVTDDDLGFTWDGWRERWIQRGMPWETSGDRRPPPFWHPGEQLARFLHDPDAHRPPDP
ncbi:MAG: hypothetical protein ABJA87_01045 [bacterium]